MTTPAAFAPDLTPELPPGLTRELEDRLVRYCAIDTQSDADSASQPSTAIQLALARLLERELAEMGAADVRITDYGAVLATIPGTKAGPVVGFLAHMDTAPSSTPPASSRG